PVCIRYGTGDSGQEECTLFTQAQSDLKLKGNGCPAWVQANDNAVGYYRVDYRGNLLSSLTQGDVTKRLNAPERVDFMGNVESLTNGGKLPTADALKLVEVFHNDPERHVVQSALNLATQPQAHLVPENLQANYQRFLLKNFQARAHELGWIPRAGESDDKTLLRPNLLPVVATDAGDKELAEQARELTNKWFTDRNAIAPNMVAATLGTAAYYGDKALFDRFLAQLKKTSDRQERARILGAIQEFRDPAAIKAGMEAVLSGEVPFMEGLGLLFAGQEAEATRKMAFEFMQAHFDEIAAKRPTGGGFDAGAIFPRVGASFCDAQSKEQLQSFFGPRIEKFTGAPRALSQTLESIDVCIAEKGAQEPSVEAFLKNY
ncbi:MAG: ERAP1-like C-terminal domain-containing protein, partial [Acidobacteriaceae bacterium]|nr:ERAP1-like C-terminal domain-containing protein [Acidobacteriaceae bacterium]